MSNIINLTDNNFSKILDNQKELCLLQFYSPSCGPCHTMNPVIDKLAKDNPSLKVYKIDTSTNYVLSSEFNIRGVPAFIFFENKKVLYSFVGITPLNNFQFVINNINDKHFRETGEFLQNNKDKNNYFLFFVIALVIVFILAIIFLN